MMTTNTCAVRPAIQNGGYLRAEYGSVLTTELIGSQAWCRPDRLGADDNRA
jgi:hypothetical protein